MLFKTIDEIKQFLAVGAGTDFMRLKPHIQNAEAAYIRPLLGPDLFAYLAAYYTSPDSVTDEAKRTLCAELLALVQRGEIHLTYWSGFQVLNATISDGGFKRTENEKVKSLFKYQEDELKQYFKTTGFNALDEVLEFLEIHKADFASEMGTADWLIQKGLFIRDTKTFNSIVFINGSRLTFLRLKPMIQLTEDLYIRPILGESAFQEIKTGLISESIPEKVTKILPFIQKPLGYLAASMLMEETSADLTESGLYFESREATNNLIANRLPANSERINLLVRKYKALGDNFLENLKSYLLLNQADWLNVSVPVGSVLRRNNTDKKSFWA
jgi:hypothetical protein